MNKELLASVLRMIDADAIRFLGLSEALTVRGSDPLFPVDERRDEFSKVVQRPSTGCSMRAYIATQIMAGIASNPGEGGPEEAADIAVTWADALIKRLNK